MCCPAAGSTGGVFRFPSARGGLPTRGSSLGSAGLGLVVSTGCALAVAACGGSSTKPRSAFSPYGPKSSPAAMSRCMRANGLSNFPDPRSGPDGGGVGFPGGLMITSSDSIDVMGTTFSGPALVHAEKACKEYMPRSGPAPTISASQKAATVANARCMRKHGVPNFPDPIFSGNQITIGDGGANSDSPALKRAAAACGGVGSAAIRIRGS